MKGTCARLRVYLCVFEQSCTLLHLSLCCLLVRSPFYYGSWQNTEICTCVLSSHILWDGSHWSAPSWFKLSPLKGVTREKGQCRGKYPRLSSPSAALYMRGFCFLVKRGSHSQLSPAKPNLVLLDLLMAQPRSSKVGHNKFAHCSFLYREVNPCKRAERKVPVFGVAEVYRKEEPINVVPMTLAHKSTAPWIAYVHGKESPPPLVGPFFPPPPSVLCPCAFSICVFMAGQSLVRGAKI